jgi:hypothetical protein
VVHQVGLQQFLVVHGNGEIFMVRTQHVPFCLSSILLKIFFIREEKLFGLD